MKARAVGPQIGVGATTELSLRVSIATLVRVLCANSRDGDLMLALERKATLQNAKTRRVVQVKSQPFGGAIRIYDIRRLYNIIGDFHFDSKVSRSTQDFRLFIRPSAWEAVRDFCLQHFSDPDNTILECEPDRELTEEFAGSLNITLKPNQYTCRPVGTVVENAASPTDNANARGFSTVRIYRLFEAYILDTSLISAMLIKNETDSEQALCELALNDFGNGGPGRANSVLTLPLKQLVIHYSIISPEVRNQPTRFQSHELDETVAAVLDGVTVPKYQRL